MCIDFHHKLKKYFVRLKRLRFTSSSMISWEDFAKISIISFISFPSSFSPFLSFECFFNRIFYVPNNAFYKMYPFVIKEKFKRWNSIWVNWKIAIKNQHTNQAYTQTNWKNINHSKANYDHLIWKKYCFIAMIQSSFSLTLIFARLNYDWEKHFKWLRIHF